jgi:spermidine synthase
MSQKKVDIKQTDLLQLGVLFSRSSTLFVVSVLALFLELLLIRWVGTEINIFAYLQNTVLVVCFMGLAFGCLTCDQPIILRNLLVPLLILVLLLSLPILKENLGNISFFLSALDNPAGWYVFVSPARQTSLSAVVAGLTATFVLMLLICQMMVPLGRLMGQLMDQHSNPISAYSINIFGSLLGIWLFVLLSAVYQPPGVWFLVVGLLTAYLISRMPLDRAKTVLLLAIVVSLSWFTGRDWGSKNTVWSPYQKLTILETGNPTIPYYVKANNAGFQWILNSDAKTTFLDPDQFSDDVRDLQQYSMPALMHPDPREVLIVGSGTGNDVVGSLDDPRVKQITAVEIDPAIIRLGQIYHPQKPYEAGKVKVINDDARSFFMTTRERYDVIIFALLDSHTMTGMTNARLDNYVYTQESFQKVRSLLKDDGVLVVKFLAIKPFIVDRLARLLKNNFGADSMVYGLSHNSSNTGPMVFVTGNLEGVKRQIASNAVLASWLGKLNPINHHHLNLGISMITDDWPYLYLSSRYIPPLYLLVALMILILLIYGNWRFKVQILKGHWTYLHWHFFFLGAGFLLLETQNISKASIVLGNTWGVNAVIISGMLIMILLANFIIWKFPGTHVGLGYAGLISSCAVLYFIDLVDLGSLLFFEKAVAVAFLTSLPIVFSGMVFIKSFSAVNERHSALGANLVGSMLGGVLQSVTFISGGRSLLLLVTFFYCAAMFCHLWSQRTSLKVSGTAPIADRA